jgi:two-component system response regulator HydG
MTILIADDDRAFTDLLAAWLREKGHHVNVAYDAATAMISATHRTPDLILLDVKMPAGSGLETLRRLKSLATTSSIPVIVASALDDAQLADRVVELGAARFFPKPVKLDELYTAIREVGGLTAS